MPLADSRIPEISDKKLKKLVAQIKPVIRFAEGRKGLFKSPEGHLYYIKKVNPRTMSYLWDPKPTDKAEGLVEFERITTYDEYGASSLFKPSIAEVLAQIPKSYRDKVVAFELTESGLSGEYHVATAVLYSRV